jgi:hypothetical protein
MLFIFEVLATSLRVLARMSFHPEKSRFYSGPLQKRRSED